MIEDILNSVKEKIENIVPIPSKYTISQGNNNGFEILVPEILESIKYEMQGIFDYYVHLGHHFPDVDLFIDNKKYGLELKSRKNGNWQTNGNSIFETITGSDYEEMYILFGSYQKAKDQIQVRYNKYWKVLPDIKVTHSPRFSINMDAESSVFEDSAEYETLRLSTESQKINFVQKYLKNNAKGSKWYIPQENEILPINLSSLDRETLNKTILETMILYPQDFFRTVGENQKIRSDYTRASQYIISTYYYFSPSFRDFFSAGGQWEYNEIKLPQVFKILHDQKELLADLLSHASQEFIEACSHSWEELEIEYSTDNFHQSYLEVLDYIGETNFSNVINQIPNGKLSFLTK